MVFRTFRHSYSDGFCEADASARGGVHGKKSSPTSQDRRRPRLAFSPRSHILPRKSTFTLSKPFFAATSLSANRRELPMPKVLRKILLVCGILSSLLYVSGDIVAAMSWHSYSYTSQSISELLAIGSPTRRFLALIPYNPLVIRSGLVFGGRPVASASCAPREFYWSPMASHPRWDPFSPCTSAGLPAHLPS